MATAKQENVAFTKSCHGVHVNAERFDCPKPSPNTLTTTQKDEGSSNTALPLPE